MSVPKVAAVVLNTGERGGHCLDAASKQLRDVLIVYYRDVAGVEKSQADINKLASKVGWQL